MKLVHWPLMGGLAPPSPLLAVPNVTAHPSTASVVITVLLYDGPLLCGFNVAIKGLSCLCRCDIDNKMEYFFVLTMIRQLMFARN